MFRKVISIDTEKKAPFHPGIIDFKTFLENIRRRVELLAIPLLSFPSENKIEELQGLERCGSFDPNELIAKLKDADSSHKALLRDIVDQLDRFELKYILKHLSGPNLEEFNKLGLKIMPAPEELFRNIENSLIKIINWLKELITRDLYPDKNGNIRPVMHVVANEANALVGNYQIHTADIGTYIRFLRAIEKKIITCRRKYGTVQPAEARALADALERIGNQLLDIYKNELIRIGTYKGWKKHDHFSLGLVRAAQLQASLMARFKDRHILLVEDCPEQQKTYITMYEKFGCKVYYAPNFTGAMEKLKKLKEEGIVPDLLATDLSFSEPKNGMDLLNEVRKMKKKGLLHITRLIVITGSLDDLETLKKLEGLGAKVLLKPFDMDQLYSLLDSFFPVELSVRKSPSKSVADKKILSRLRKR
jgi:CheY-like chemotaxis protein